MSIEVAKSVAASFGASTQKVTVTWHGGEPMSCGLSHFRSLVETFSGVQHVIQTNATLINPAWCDFFLNHQINVGVSVDGPALLNSRRVDWNNRSAHNQIMRGVDLLREAGVEFSVICVVDPHALPDPATLYDFFCSLGCFSLGINIEEQVGTHFIQIRNASGIKEFWLNLFKVWQQKPTLNIREFDRSLSWMTRLSEGVEEEIDGHVKVDAFPTIGYNGDVVLLSPEFLGMRSANYGHFVAWNVLRESLDIIISRWRECEYVADFFKGVVRCRKECEYFGVCRGGQASNKYFESGTTNTTKTRFCTNSQQLLVEAILTSL